MFAVKKYTNYAFSGPWPNPHTNEGHAQVGDGPDADYAHSEDTKYVFIPAISHFTQSNPMSRGPWPNPHSDKSYAQIGDGPDCQPIVAHNEDTKSVSNPIAHPFTTHTNSSSRGLWPNPYENNGYVEEGGHIIKTHDNGYVIFNLPRTGHPLTLSSFSPNDLPQGYEYWQGYEHQQ